VWSAADLRDLFSLLIGAGTALGVLGTVLIGLCNVLMTRSSMQVQLAAVRAAETAALDARSHAALAASVAQALTENVGRIEVNTNSLTAKAVAAASALADLTGEKRGIDLGEAKERARSAGDKPTEAS
jgi:hypothetical protein